MKTKLLLTLLLLVTSLTGFCTIWTIKNSGTTFTPASITITLGDTVNFVIQSTHNAKEVSEATWDANGSAALAGGFQLPFGGGMVFPIQLGTGTHYYVCSPHVSLGMKGTIIVHEPDGVAEYNQWQTNISVYPNPSNGQFQYTIKDLKIAKNCNIEIYNSQGRKMYQSPITSPESDIDLCSQAKGIYFVKIYDGEVILTKTIVIE